MLVSDTRVQGWHPLPYSPSETPTEISAFCLRVSLFLEVGMHISACSGSPTE